MAKLLSGKGVTTNVTIGGPPQGMKWIVKYALIVLHTGTGTGSRQADIRISLARAGVYSSNVPLLANTGSISSTSTAASALGYPINVSASPGQLTIFYQFPEIYAVDSIYLNANLISGDTVDYYIMVEEVVA